MTVLDIAPIIVWAAGISSLVSLATTIWAWLTAASRKNDTRIADLSGRVDGHSERLGRLEQTLSGMPAKDDMHNLQLSLSDIRGDLREMRATMKGSNEIMKRMEAIVTRHEDHLLDGAKR